MGCERTSDGRLRDVYHLSLAQLRSVVEQPSWYAIPCRALECLAFAREVHRAQSPPFGPGDRVECHDFYLIGPRPEPSAKKATAAAPPVAIVLEPVAKASESAPTAGSETAQPVATEALAADSVQPKAEAARPPAATQAEPVAKKAKAIPAPVPKKAEAAPPPVQSTHPYPDIVPPPPPVRKAQAPAVMPPPLPPAKSAPAAAAAAATAKRPRGVRGGQNKHFYAQLYAGYRKHDGHDW